MIRGRAAGQAWPGVPLALGAAALFGATAPLAKALLGTADPWVLAGILYLGAGIGLAIAQTLRRLVRLPAREATLSRRDLPWLAAVVVIGGGIGPVLLMLGLARTSASTGSLLLNVEGAATMVIAWVGFREPVDRRLFAGAAAILAGAVLLTWSGGEVRLDGGALLVVGAALCWAIDNNLTRRLSAADPVQIATIKGLAAGTANLALGLLAGASVPPAQSILGGAIVGLFGIGVSLVLFMLGLRHLGAARTGAYFSTAPFIGSLLAIVLLGEAPTLQLGLAAVLMGAGLWLHLSEDHAHEHVHEPIEHEHSHVHDAHHRHAHAEAVSEPHTHMHRHEPARHSHPHYPDLHHRHGHG